MEGEHGLQAVSCEQALGRFNARGVLERPRQKVVVAGGVTGFGSEEEPVHDRILETGLFVHVPNARRHAAHVVSGRHGIEGSGPSGTPFFSDDVAVNDHVQGRAAGAKLVADEQKSSRQVPIRPVGLVVRMPLRAVGTGDHRSQQHQSDKTHLERLGGESAESLDSGPTSTLLAFSSGSFLVGSMSMRAGKAEMLRR